MKDESEHRSQPPDPAKAYTPFSALEIGRLQRYANRVHAFEQTEFTKVETINLKFRGEAGKQATATVSGFTDQVLKQALMELRPLYLQDEPAGFQQCQAIVKRHARDVGTNEGSEAIEQIKNHTRFLDSILNGPMPIQLRELMLGPGREVLSDEQVKPRRIFEDFMNGIYFHEDEERRARIGEWLHTELQRFVFVNMVHDISHVYRSFATIVQGILVEPTLRASPR